MDHSDKERVLLMYREAKGFVAKAEADPEHKGIEHARDMLKNAEKLMRQYKLSDDA